MEGTMTITNFYYNHGNIAYIEFRESETVKMLSLEHFIARFGSELLNELLQSAA